MKTLMISCVLKRLLILGLLLTSVGQLYASTLLASTTTITMLVVYTDEIADVYAGDPSVRINDMVTTANVAFADSNIDLELQVVGIEHITHLPGLIVDVPSLSAVTFDPVINQMRNTLNADLVTLLAPATPQFCGVGWRPEKLDFSWGQNALDPQCPNFVLAHEVGHNLGLAHSARQGNTNGLYLDGMGHGVDGVFATMMAYDSEFANAAKLFVYSDPDADCLGFPCGEVGVSNAVRAVNLSAPSIATYCGEGGCGRSQCQVTNISDTLSGTAHTKVIAMNDYGDVLLNHNGLKIWNSHTHAVTAVSGFNTAVAINNQGQVAGWNYVSDGTIHGYLWDNGVVTDLGTLGSKFMVSDLNDHGFVTGYSVDNTGSNRNVLWNGSTLVDLGPGGGGVSINNRDQILLHTGFTWSIWDDYIQTTISPLPSYPILKGFNDFARYYGTFYNFSDYFTLTHGLFNGLVWNVNHYEFGNVDTGSFNSTYQTEVNQLNNGNVAVGKGFSGAGDIGVVYFNVVRGTENINNVIPAGLISENLTSAIDINTNGDIIASGTVSGSIQNAYYINSICVQ